MTINQPGTVIQDLYLQDGKLPAFAASRKGKGKHHRKVVPPAQLVARGSTTAKSAGTVSVLISATAQGRRLLRHRGKVQLVLVTTLHERLRRQAEPGAPHDHAQALERPAQVRTLSRRDGGVASRTLARR